VQSLSIRRLQRPGMRAVLEEEFGRYQQGGSLVSLNDFMAKHCRCRRWFIKNRTQPAPQRCLLCRHGRGILQQRWDPSAGIFSPRTAALPGPNSLPPRVRPTYYVNRLAISPGTGATLLAEHWAGIFRITEVALLSPPQMVFSGARCCFPSHQRELSRWLRDPGQSWVFSGRWSYVDRVQSLVGSRAHRAGLCYRQSDHRISSLKITIRSFGWEMSTRARMEERLYPGQ